MDYIVPISEARGHLPELIKKIARAGKHLIVTKNGRAEAVVHGFENLEVMCYYSNVALGGILCRKSG